MTAFYRPPSCRRGAALRRAPVLIRLRSCAEAGVLYERPAHESFELWTDFADREQISVAILAGRAAGDRPEGAYETKSVVSRRRLLPAHQPSSPARLWALSEVCKREAQRAA